MDDFVNFVIFVPVEYKEQVKKAIAENGGGSLGAYDSCFWETEGTGQFRPLQGSNPFIGEQGTIETVREVRIECICPSKSIRSVIEAAKAVHPYEVPAFHYYYIHTQ